MPQAELREGNYAVALVSITPMGLAGPAEPAPATSPDEGIGVCTGQVCTLADQSDDGMQLEKMNDNSGLIGAPFPHTAERQSGGGEYWLVARPIPGRTLTGLLRAALGPAQEPNARRRCASQTV
jgi:hypothetical protein